MLGEHSAVWDINKSAYPENQQQTPKNLSDMVKHALLLVVIHQSEVLFLTVDNDIWKHRFT